MSRDCPQRGGGGGGGRGGGGGGGDCYNCGKPGHISRDCTEPRQGGGGGGGGRAGMQCYKCQGKTTAQVGNCLIIMIVYDNKIHQNYK